MAAALACLVLALATPASARSLRADDSDANGVLPSGSSPYFSALSAIRQAGYTAQYAGAPALAPAAALAAASAPAVRTAGPQTGESAQHLAGAACSLCAADLYTICRNTDCQILPDLLLQPRQPAVRVTPGLPGCMPPVGNMWSLAAFLGEPHHVEPCSTSPHTCTCAERCWAAGHHGGAAGAAARARARAGCRAGARLPRPRARPGGGGRAVGGAARGGRAGRGGAAGGRAGGRRRGGRARARPVRADGGAAEGPGRARRARPAGRGAAGAGARPGRQEGESWARASSSTAAPSRRALAQHTRQAAMPCGSPCELSGPPGRATRTPEPGGCLAWSRASRSTPEARARARRCTSSARRSQRTPSRRRRCWRRCGRSTTRSRKLRWPRPPTPTPSSRRTSSTRSCKPACRPPRSRSTSHSR